MNKHIKKITLISGCITSLLFSYGCSEELFVDEQNRNEKELIVKERTSTRIEKLSSLPEFNSFLNENIIQNKFSKSAKKTSLDGEKNVFVVEKNGTTSYSIIFYNEYGFDILVYNKGEKESSMIVKFIPDSKTKNNSFEDFTGLVKYFTLKGTLLGENRFENAKPITTPTNPQKSNKGSSNCSSTTITIAFPCNSGKHYPGQSCDLSGSERAYYEYYTYTNCYVDEFPYPDGGGGGFGNPGDGPGPGGGGGGGLSELAFAIYLNSNANISQKYLSLSDDEKQYVEFLFFSQGQYLTEFAINLLSSNSSIELYQFVKWVDWYKEYKLSNTNVESYFMQNPQDLDVLFNFSSNGEGFIQAWLEELINNTNEYPLNNTFYIFQYDYKSQMSTEELNIFNTLSPQSQFKYLKNAYNALNKAASLYPYSTHNGKGDAFRHAYFNTLNVISIGKYYTEKLTTAHENRPPNYAFAFKETNMDLFNNNVGRNYGDLILAGNSSSAENLIKLALQNGELMYLTPLGNDNCPTCANNISKLTPTNQ